MRAWKGRAGEGAGFVWGAHQRGTHNAGAGAGSVSPKGWWKWGCNSSSWRWKQTLVLEARNLHSFYSLPSSSSSCACTVRTSHDFVPLQGYLTFSYCLSLAIKNSWVCKGPEAIDNPWMQIASDLQTESIKSVMAFSETLENGGHHLDRSTLQSEKGG